MSGIVRLMRLEGRNKVGFSCFRGVACGVLFDFMGGVLWLYPAVGRLTIHGLMSVCITGASLMGAVLLNQSFIVRGGGATIDCTFTSLR